ncbi:MFS transporter [Psychromicrobium xiongbiense]|uniref:MFS transporter n=1 Tax=Psychromicrobium xiongbiense TaxID=3051184 RepID=UPI002553B269|nr:MFS transporter [Psychromicrobium sp. YIM S02556]
MLVELTSGILQGYYVPLWSDVARRLGIHDADVNWFEAAQLLVSALVVPLLATWGDLLGHRKILLISTAITAVACWGVAFAPTFWVFLMAWAVQGFYVVWLPLEVALIYSRSQLAQDPAALTRRATGVLVAALEGGVIVGALLSGVLGSLWADQLWLVLAFPALCVSACFVAIWKGVPAPSTSDTGADARTGDRSANGASRGRIDGGGFVLAALSLLGITGGLTLMRLSGPGTWWAWVLVAVGLLALLPFARYEMRRSEPLIDVRLLARPTLWPVMLTAFLFGVSVLGAQIPLSTFARTDPATAGYGLGVGAGLVSVLIGVYVLAMVAGALVFPWLAARLSPRRTLIIAALVVALGYGLFLPFHDQLVQVLLNMVIAGLGSGALVAALPAAAAAAAPLHQTGMATGATNATKTLGGSFASCIFGIALAHGITAPGVGEGQAAPLAGYLTVWSICALTAVLSAAALLVVPKAAFGGPLRTGRLRNRQTAARELSE